MPKSEQNRVKLADVGHSGRHYLPFPPSPNLLGFHFEKQGSLT